jgi:2-polyprenyl-3-methyl-5-hydroxy-6-metoxy-1,4-benzoquinol methylase
LLLEPALLRLLAPKEGEQILEVACGNGAFARKLASIGCSVTATDYSHAFLRCARSRTPVHQDRISYLWFDATDAEQLSALGDGVYDAIVANMALMDMSTIEPLMQAIPRLLVGAGRFVFSVMHPCFNSVAPGNTLLLEETDVNGQSVTTRSVKVSRYLTPCHTLGLGMAGQPVPHHYFFRPLSALLSAAFEAGLVLDGLEEPAFDTPMPSERPLSWGRFSEIPPVMVVRLRPVG